MRKRRLLVFGIVLAAAVVGIGLGWLLWRMRPSPLLTKFDQVGVGMTRAEVEAVMGPPLRPPEEHVFSTEMARGVKVVLAVQQVMTWEDRDTSCTVYFSADDWRVVSKSVREDPVAFAMRENVRKLLGWSP